MSDSNRFAGAIKRIVEPLIPKKTGSADAVIKGVVAGARGIAYFNEDGTIGSRNGAAGVTLAPEISPIGLQNATDAAAEAAAGAAIAQKGANGAANGALDGVYDADDLLSGDNRPAISGALDGAAEMLLGISGLTDIVSGATFRLRMDGGFSFPPGWTGSGSGTPPTGTGWDPNYYWTGSSGYGGAAAGATLYQCGANVTALAFGYYNALYTVTSSRYVSTSYTPGGASANYNVELYLTWNSPNEINNGWVSVPIGCTRSACSGVGNPSPYCTIAEPDGSFVPWPSLGFFQVAFLLGQFVTNINDTDVPLGWTTARSIIDATTLLGNFVRITPLKDGGFAYHETVADAAVGDAQIYRQNNTLAAIIPVAQLPPLLP